MPTLTIDQLDGGAALCAWFGDSPSFHDAKLLELEISQGHPGRFVVQTFQILPQTDADGYFALTKHVVVTLMLFDLVTVELFDFTEAAIIFDLAFEIDDSGVTLSFNSSYGVNGKIKAKRSPVLFEPVK